MARFMLPENAEAVIKVAETRGSPENGLIKLQSTKIRQTCHLVPGKSLIRFSRDLIFKASQG